MFDSRTESLIASGATVKTYTKKNMSRVTITLKDGTDYSATGHSFDIAMERVLSKVDARSKNLKEQRRSKERLRRQILDSLDEADGDYCR